MKGVGISSAKVHVDMEYYLGGSVLKGTVSSGWTGVQSHFEVESDEDQQTVMDVIRLAKQGCFAERLVEDAVPLSSTVKLNGEEFDL